MTDLTLERSFAADVETVFAFVTQTEHLLKWWGPEGMSVPQHTLDFTRLGPWTSTMVNAEGGKHKVSGEVMKFEPPHAVEFTWAWHDDDDVRGHDSRVRFELTPSSSGGTEFKLVHTGLADTESANNHNMGWTSSLRKLEKLAQPSS